MREGGTGKRGRGSRRAGRHSRNPHALRGVSADPGSRVASGGVIPEPGSVFRREHGTRGVVLAEVGKARAECLILFVLISVAATWRRRRGVSCSGGSSWKWRIRSGPAAPGGGLAIHVAVDLPCEAYVETQRSPPSERLWAVLIAAGAATGRRAPFRRGPAVVVRSRFSAGQRCVGRRGYRLGGGATAPGYYLARRGLHPSAGPGRQRQRQRQRRRVPAVPSRPCLVLPPAPTNTRNSSADGIRALSRPSRRTARRLSCGS